MTNKRLKLQPTGQSVPERNTVCQSTQHQTSTGHTEPSDAVSVKQRSQIYLCPTCIQYIYKCISEL